jgi:hypothetical protein
MALGGKDVVGEVGVHPADAICAIDANLDVWGIRSDVLHLAARRHGFEVALNYRANGPMDRKQAVMPSMKTWKTIRRQPCCILVRK